MLPPLAALVLLACTAAAQSRPAHPCSDPCLQAARGALRDCTSSAEGAFVDALGACVRREHTCVQACRSGRRDCLDATGAGAALVACAGTVTAEKARCRERFPPGSERRENCIDRAEAAGFRCRARVRRDVRRAVLACEAGFDRCTNGCGPGEPPQGADTCRADARAVSKAHREVCRETYQVTASACLDKDVTCVQTCADGRDACRAPVQATLGAALAACRAEEASAAAACRDAALAAAEPGVAACTVQYLGCVRGCP